MLSSHKAALQLQLFASDLPLNQSEYTADTLSSNQNRVDHRKWNFYVIFTLVHLYKLYPDLGCDKRRDKTRECLCQLVQKLDINFTKLPLPSYLAPSPPTHTVQLLAAANVPLHYWPHLW